jgi:hypothetical protein
MLYINFGGKRFTKSKEQIRALLRGWIDLTGIMNKVINYSITIDNLAV